MRQLHYETMADRNRFAVFSGISVSHPLFQPFAQTCKEKERGKIFFFQTYMYQQQSFECPSTISMKHYIVFI